MSATRNTRLAWIAQEIKKGKSSGAIVLDCMTAFPGVSEKTARKDLKEILRRLNEIEIELTPEMKTRLLEVAWELMQEARSLAQMGPAVNQFKTIVAMMGLLDEKGSAHDKNLTPQGVPDNQVIRDRIAQLMRSKKIKEQAEAAGIDLDGMKE